MSPQQCSPIIIPLVIVALALPALAQDAGDDWDLREDATRGLTMATLEYDGAPALAVRCVGEELAVLVGGLPLAPDPSRVIEVSLDGRDVGGPWKTAADGAAAVNGAPAIAARDLAHGGSVQVRVPTSSDRWTTYRLDVPKQSAAVGRVLEACGRPRVDPRDALARLPVADMNPWARLPAGEYPQLAARNGVTSGEVVTSCIIAENNSLTDCRVESETPAGNGFGQAALAGLRSARVAGAADGRPVANSLLLHFTRFRLD